MIDLSKGLGVIAMILEVLRQRDDVGIDVAIVRVIAMHLRGVRAQTCEYASP